MHLPSHIDDFHIHLRQDALMNTVTPLLESTAKVRLAYVMPNLKPPITTTQMALDYQSKLKQLAPNVEFLMTLYLVPELTVQEIYKAAKNGIKGVKSYPRGVTTNSDSGIESYDLYYPLFKVMEETGMVLNLHGEIPSDPLNDICVLNAEEAFLKHLKQLHMDFPKLRIVLEHASTKAAVDMVKSLGETVACTITIHHLVLTVDDWAGQCHHYCKPVAKYPKDRQALQQVILQGHPRFFLGTDSAPHARHTKESDKSAAGVFTGAYTYHHLVSALQSFGGLDKLKAFACENGRRFYGLSLPKEEFMISYDTDKRFEIPKEIYYEDDQEEKRSVVPFQSGNVLNFDFS